MLTTQKPNKPESKGANGRGTARKRRAKYVQRRWDAFDWIEGTYLIGCLDRVKIGWSRNMGARFRNIMEGLPAPMRLYTWIEGDCGREIELGLHRRFKDLREHREWFRLEGALKEFLAPNMDLYIDGTARTEEALKEAVWRQAHALWPDLERPDELLDVPRRTGPAEPEDDDDET